MLARARLLDRQPPTIETAANLDGEGARGVDRSHMKMRLLAAYLALAA
jgi:hypothetical protein